MDEMSYRKFQDKLDEYVLLSNPIVSMMCELRMVGQIMQCVHKSNGSIEINYAWKDSETQANYEKCEEVLESIRKLCGFE